MRTLCFVASSLILGCGSTTHAPAQDAATETGGASDAAIDTRHDTATVPDAPPEKCPAFRKIDCGGKGACPLGETCVAMTDAPTVDAGDVDPIVVPSGVCTKVPASCLTYCPSTDCVCAAWAVAAGCTIDSTRSCDDRSGIVPVVYCAKK